MHWTQKVEQKKKNEQKHAVFQNDLQSKRVLQEVGNTGTGMDGSPILKVSILHELFKEELTL